MKSFRNRWNYAAGANEYKEENVISVQKTIRSLCPPWVEVRPPVLDNEGDSLLDLPFSEEELEWAISNLRIEFSSGIDGIDYKMILVLPKEVRYYLLQLYNEIYAKGEFPIEWRQYAISCIPKSDSAKMRTISLAPCLLKIFERKINCTMSWWLEYHDKLPHLQFGFRRSRSCINNLAILNSGILKEFENNKYITALFVDIRSAYDNVLADVLVIKT